MWKWIGIALLVIVALVGTCSYVAYRQLNKMATGDSTSTIVIDAKPERVFASLATADSLSSWMVAREVRASRAGRLRVGDTVIVVTRDTAAGMRDMNWVVTELTPPAKLTLEIRAAGPEVPLALVRRFELETRGDSTAVKSTLVMPGGDSLATKSGAQGGAGAMLQFGARVMLGALRMQSTYEVGQLKAHLEGTAMPAPGKAP